MRFTTQRFLIKVDLLKVRTGIKNGFLCNVLTQHR